MKKLWTWLKSICLRKWWYVILLIISSIYVWHYRFSIIDFSTIEAQDLIFFLWLILLVFPLFSEIEILGVKVKKEIEKSVQEVKEDIAELRLQIVSSNSSAVANSETNFIFSAEFLQALTEKAGLPKSRDIKKADTVIDAQFLDKEVIAPTEATFLFSVRYAIEKRIVELYQLLGNERIYTSLASMLQELRKSELLDNDMVTLLFQITKIANRGIHGESISQDYTEFIQSVFPDVIRKLDEIIDTFKKGNQHYFVCPRCNYRGFSKKENICPNCGFTSDDY